MPATEKIKTRCPMCHTAYRVPNTQIGHRARCPKCDSVFRVTVPTLPEEPRRPHTPTEDDIVAWLNEASERDDDLPAGPRRWESTAPPPPQDAKPTTTPTAPAKPH